MSSDRNIVFSVKAGKLRLEGKTLVPDHRTGQLIVFVEDEMSHVAWRERKEGGVLAPCKLEDEQVVFPNEAVLSQIGSTRNLVLKFTDDMSRNSFFWMQEPDASQDSDLITGFNSIVYEGNTTAALASDMQIDAPLPSAAIASSHHPSGGISSGGMRAAAAASGPSPSPPPPNLATILESALKAATNPSAPSPSPSLGLTSPSTQGSVGNLSSEAATNQLAASLLLQMQGGGYGVGGQGQNTGRKRAAAEAMMRGMASDQGPTLQEVMKADLVVSLLDKIAARSGSSSLSADVAVGGGGDTPNTLGGGGGGGGEISPLLVRLGEFLPDEHKGDEKQLRETFNSVAFKSQVASLSHALQTGQLDFKQFGLDGSGFSVIEFLEAFERAAQKKKEGK